MKNRTLALILAVVVCLILAGSISGTGRRWMNRVAGLFKSPTSAPAAVAPAATLQQADVESTARAQHGWSSSIEDSVVSGKIACYDERGHQTSSGEVTFYRIYPDLLRVEIAWETSPTPDVYGVDQAGAWIQGAAEAPADDLQDVRAFLRIWPERLFVARDHETHFRGVGSHTEDFKPGEPGQPPLDIDPPNTFDLVEVEDVIQLDSPDQRRIYYFVNHQSSVVSALQYIELDDPNADPRESDTETTQVRVDFDDWRTVNNVLWPFLITHRLGGKVDFRIWVGEVFMNQSPSPSLFQRP